MSIEAARRVALAAQGFSCARPECSVNAGHIRRVVDQLGLLQLDFVNVLVPAHYLILFSRLGGFDLKTFDRAIYGCGRFTEQWAHEASIVPIASWPLLQHRREDFRPWPNSPIMRLKGRAKYLMEVIEIVRNKGPVTSQDLPPLPGPKRKPGDWHRSVPRWALEYHFGSGALAVEKRRSNFQRVYDLSERLIDRPHYELEITRDEQQKHLLSMAATACGIGTIADLADYYRMSPREAAPRIADLVHDGRLVEVDVAGWKASAYMPPKQRVPRTICASSLLSPFDPVVWFRPRAERLFDFHYRIEIYVPANKRKWGYYVLPFLLDDRIVARVDLKADRKNGTLLVLAAHPEIDIETDRVLAALADELRKLADWLGLAVIKVSRRGPYARALADTIKRA